MGLIRIIAPGQWPASPSNCLLGTFRRPPDCISHVCSPWHLAARIQDKLYPVGREERLHQKIDKSFAKRDYLKALKLIEKTGSVTDESRKQIDQAVARLNKLAKSEFVAGRWSVAEEIAGEVQQHMDLMDSRRQDELWALIQELAAGREKERNHAMIRAATHLASETMYIEAYEVAISAIQTCTDLPMAGRLRRLLRGLPHPDGFYVAGFDSEHEARQLWTGKNGAMIEARFDRKDNIRGGYGRLILPPKSGVFITEVPNDWSKIESIRMLARSVTDQPARVTVGLESEHGGIRATAVANEPLWAKKILKLNRFHGRGNSIPAP